MASGEDECKFDGARLRFFTARQRPDRGRRAHEFPLIYINLPRRESRNLAGGAWRVRRKVPIMLRYILALLAAVVLLTACLIPDDAEARRGGGAYRGGGYRGGAVAVRGPRGGGAVAVRGAGYRGYGYGGRGYGYRGYGVGAAAVGAAAVGAAAVGGAAYRRNCYDPYGNWICAY